MEAGCPCPCPHKEINPMPMLHITMLAGRTPDQKRKLVERLTDALVEEAGAKRGSRYDCVRGSLS